MAVAMLAAGGCAAPQAPAPVAPAAFDAGAASCGASADPRFARAIEPAALDPALMDRAIRFHTNRERCAAGRGALAAAPALARAAAMQAHGMAAAGVVADVVPGSRDLTLERRFYLAGVGRHAGRAENLMRITLEEPGVARVRSRAPRCDFTASGPDSALTPTYGSTARRLVDAWMQSEAMRATMLSPDWTDLGAAVAVRAVEGSCGDVYAVQSFVKR